MNYYLCIVGTQLNFHGLVNVQPTFQLFSLYWERMLFFMSVSKYQADSMQLGHDPLKLTS